MRRLFDYDPIMGTAEYFHYDEATGDGYIETVEDETALFEANKREYDSYTGKAGWGDGSALNAAGRYLRLSGRMVAQLQRSGILNDQDLLMAWADTAEARPYRTRPGKLAGTRFS